MATSLRSRSFLRPAPLLVKPGDYTADFIDLKPSSSGFTLHLAPLLAPDDLVKAGDLPRSKNFRVFLNLGTDGRADWLWDRVLSAFGYTEDAIPVIEPHDDADDTTEPVNDYPAIVEIIKAQARLFPQVVVHLEENTYQPKVDGQPVGDPVTRMQPSNIRVLTDKGVQRSPIVPDNAISDQDPQA